MGQPLSAHVNRSLMAISRRAESVDRHTLAKTFVVAGSFSAMLHSADHQILYGRRGTGKTHALLYLADLVEETHDVAVYLDLRTVGSTSGLYANQQLPVSLRGTQLLVDTLEAVHEQLLTTAIEARVSDQEGLLQGLDELTEAATTVEVIGNVERETTVGGSAEQSASAGASASWGPGGPRGQVRMSGSSRHSVTASDRLRRTGTEHHQVIFGPLSRALARITAALAPARLWLLLDEWSSIPLELQPLLADLLRRSVLPTRGTTVKIAAIERRSRFREPGDEGDYVGIEVGADAASAVSFDDVLRFDHGRTQSRQFFAELFLNHVRPRMPVTDDPAEFVATAFSRTAFPELVRAAEGVPRDAINIAALAAQHANTATIGIRHVRQAAQDWYLRDKYAAIAGNEPALTTLRWLVDEVVGRRRSRTFLLDHATGANDPTMRDLNDARLVHLVRRGIVNRKRPGTLYDGFAIDYGCYVALLADGEQPSRRSKSDAWLTDPHSALPESVPLEQLLVELPGAARSVPRQRKPRE